jgi:hypothetical protein
MDAFFRTLFCVSFLPMIQNIVSKENIQSAKKKTRRMARKKNKKTHF